MRASAQYSRLLDAKGRSLAVMGVSYSALKRTDALRAVEILRADEIPILGGDVWIFRNGKFETAYANWHSEPNSGEGRAAYLNRGWNAAEAYIRRYPDDEGSEPYFSIVTGEVL